VWINVLESGYKNGLVAQQKTMNVSARNLPEGVIIFSVGRTEAQSAKTKALRARISEVSRRALGSFCFVIILHTT